MSQIISTPLADAEAKNTIKELRDALLKKAGIHFPKMVYLSQPSQLTGKLCVIIIPSILLEIFSDEIESGSGGGGRGYNPMSTRPTPGSRSV